MCGRIKTDPPKAFRSSRSKLVGPRLATFRLWSAAAREPRVSDVCRCQPRPGCFPCTIPAAALASRHRREPSASKRQPAINAQSPGAEPRSRPTARRGLAKRGALTSVSTGKYWTIAGSKQPARGVKPVRVHRFGAASHFISASNCRRSAGVIMRTRCATTSRNSIRERRVASSVS